MTLLNMKRFQEWLKMENAKRLSTERPIIEPFYPDDFLRKQPTIRRSAESEETGRANAYDAVSKDFANLIFLKGTEDDIDSFVDDKLNTDSRIYLKHYLDTDGTQAIVPDQTMECFIQECVKYRGRLEITPPLSSIEAMDKVKIISGPFAGHEATVARVQLSRGTILLDLTIPLVAGVMNIRMSDVNKKNIMILNRESTDAIRTDFIEYTQNHLLTILEHRVKRVTDETVNRRDADMLTRLYRYRHHQVKNEAARNHFMALMLICAHLCRFTAEEEELKQWVMEKLATINQKSESKAATDTRTYLWIALYVATHDPSYRDAIKQYARDHQPKSMKLRRFIYLIRAGKKV